MKANKNLQRLLSILLSGAMIASAPMSAWADDFTDAAAQVESVQTEENTQDEVQQDAEGIQIMRTLGNNMAWLLKCLEAGKKAGIEMPVDEEKIKTNFIR